MKRCVSALVVVMLLLPVGFVWAGAAPSINIGYPNSTVQQNGMGGITTCGTVSNPPQMTLLGGLIFNLDLPPDSQPVWSGAPGAGDPDGSSGSAGKWQIPFFGNNPLSATSIKGYKFRVADWISGASKEVNFTYNASGTAPSPCPFQFQVKNSKKKDDDAGVAVNKEADNPVRIRHLRVVAEGEHRFVQIHGFIRHTADISIHGEIVAKLNTDAGPKTLIYSGKVYRRKVDKGTDVVVDIPVTHVEAAKYKAGLGFFNLSGSGGGMAISPESVHIANKVTISSK